MRPNRLSFDQFPVAVNNIRKYTLWDIFQEFRLNDMNAGECQSVGKVFGCNINNIHVIIDPDLVKWFAVVDNECCQTPIPSMSSQGFT